MPVATLRPAATVVVVRDTPGADHGFDVLMVRRNDKVAFMAGANVFPGGRVDEVDLALAGGDEAHAFRLAAVRELEEEAGVRADPAELLLIAHWVTPEIEVRRYDTRFFLVRMPPGQDAKHDDGETTELAWLTPGEAIARCDRGEIMLPPPTWTTLKRAGRQRTSGELFAWARGVAIPRVQPQFHTDDERTMLTLPGDPTYPTIDGWEVPEDTRFLLQDGRWRPVRA
ncbi:MAG: NUDIX hydrolase [Acidobacteria bacterium]|nr:NUDIX hydrolase [Acidobacteriota bacterium]